MDIPQYYLGILSDLRRLKAPVIYRAIAILSGPEPQRSLLEKLLFDHFIKMEGQFLMVLGKPESRMANNRIDNVKLVPFMGSRALEKAVAQSAVVVCRSGYSSIMDLVQLQKRAILIPTPQQPEQEYLADRLGKELPFLVQAQNRLDIRAGIEILEKRSEDAAYSSFWEGKEAPQNLSERLQRYLK